MVAFEKIDPRWQGEERNHVCAAQTMVAFEKIDPRWQGEERNHVYAAQTMVTFDEIYSRWPGKFGQRFYIAPPHGCVRKESAGDITELRCVISFCEWGILGIEELRCAISLLEAVFRGSGGT
ncbi:hypothetical protein [Paenibacillus mucilaginosus]|uniref:hypothetical protein n=1 Tax=Paenibacillus mucilaginosus TaxID=61624 RepID=UPI003D19DD7A